MRIHNTAFFPLTIGIASKNAMPTITEINVYDCSFHCLPVKSKKKNSIMEFETNIELPNKLIIEIGRTPNQCFLELEYFILAGIKVGKELLLKCLEHKMTPVNNSLRSLDQLSNTITKKTLVWEEGYVVIDLFHSNPFAWHLFLGNKIKF